jgi:transposase-like protein
VDKSGQTTAFRLTEQRDEQAARRFLIQVIRRGGVPKTITIGGGEVNAAALREYKGEDGTVSIIRQVQGSATRVMLSQECPTQIAFVPKVLQSAPTSQHDLCSTTESRAGLPCCQTPEVIPYGFME